MYGQQNAMAIVSDVKVMGQTHVFIVQIMQVVIGTIIVSVTQDGADHHAKFTHLPPTIQMSVIVIPDALADVPARQIWIV